MYICSLYKNIIPRTFQPHSCVWLCSLLSRSTLGALAVTPSYSHQNILLSRPSDRNPWPWQEVPGDPSYIWSDRKDFSPLSAQGKGFQQCHDQGQLGCTGDAGGDSGLTQPWYSTCCGFCELLCSHSGCRLPILPISAFALGASPTPCQAGLRFHLLPRQNEQADDLLNLGVREDNLLSSRYVRYW